MDRAYSYVLVDVAITVLHYGESRDYSDNRQRTKFNEFKQSLDEEIFKELDSRCGRQESVQKIVDSIVNTKTDEFDEF